LPLLSGAELRLDREASALLALDEAKDIDGPRARLAPRLLAASPDCSVLVTEGLPGTSPVGGGAPGGDAGDLGIRVALVHGSRSLAGGDFPVLARPAPAFQDVPVEYLMVRPPALGEAVRYVQNSILSPALTAACRGWRASCFIHGDLTATNLLRWKEGARQGTSLVDWELCGIGDPHYDLGCLLGSLVLRGNLRGGNGKQQVRWFTQFLRSYANYATRPPEIARIFAWGAHWLVAHLLMRGPQGDALCPPDRRILELAESLIDVGDDQR
jgi:hypothetical protein